MGTLALPEQRWKTADLAITRIFKIKLCDALAFRINKLFSENISIQTKGFCQSL